MSLFTLINARGESVDILNDGLLAYSPTGLGVNFSNTYSQYENYFKNTKSQVSQGQMSINIMFGDVESTSYQTFSQFASFLNYEPLTLVYSTDSGTWNRDAKVGSLSKSEIGGTSVLQTDRLVEQFSLEFINPWYNNKEGKYKSYDEDPKLGTFGKGYFTSIGYSPEDRNYFIIKTATKGFINTDGSVNAVSNHGLVSDYISVNAGDSWQLTGRYNAGVTDSGFIRYGFYDTNKKLILRQYSNTVIPLTSVTVTVPANAVYMRVSFDWTADGYGTAKVEKGTTYSDYTPSPEDDPSQMGQTWNYGYQEFIN